MKKMSTAEITNIAIGVGILFTGGWAILTLSRFIPFPGGKYLLMSPYSALILYLMQRKVPRFYTSFAFSLVFALIMTIINMFMGAAILLTGIMTSLILFFVRSEALRPTFAGVLYAAFTLITALTISKYLIGGAFLMVPNWWIGLSGVLGGIFGLLGTTAGKRIARNLRM